MSYLYPAMIVALIGLVAGVILTVAAKFMAVPVNEKVGELEMHSRERIAELADLQDVMPMQKRSQRVRSVRFVL